MVRSSHFVVAFTRSAFPIDLATPNHFLNWSLLNLEDILLVRRVGRVKLGEVISVVAATSPNSEDAFEACRLGIARLRRMKTIVKNEVRR